MAVRIGMTSPTSMTVNDRIYQDGRLVLAGGLILKNNSLLLLRRRGSFYETPGGKVQPGDCVDSASPTIADFANGAVRELGEELGAEVVFGRAEYVMHVKFSLPNGLPAVAYKFTVPIITGVPRIAEPETFDSLEYVFIRDLARHNLSPDLKLLSSTIEARFS